MPKKTTVPENKDDNSVDNKVKELLELAKKEGKIDQKHILKEIPETPENIDALDSLYEELADANITITASGVSGGDGVKDDWAAEEEDDEEIIVQDTRYLDDVADDSVRLYLREIGKIPLLTSEEELALAQKVVSGDKRAKDKMAATALR